MMTNANITIFNKKINPGMKREEYCKTVLRDVHWYTDQKVNVGEGGLKSADVYKIRVPAGRRQEQYIPPEEYAALPWGEHIGYWTVENGDLFVKGIVEDEIEKPSDLAKKHYIVGKVLSHSDNRRGLSPHIRIGGA